MNSSFFQDYECKTPDALRRRLTQTETDKHRASQQQERIRQTQQTIKNQISHPIQKTAKQRDDQNLKESNSC